MTESLLTDQNDQSQIDTTKSYVEQLVGEGKKFKTSEDLARGKYEADVFIANKNKAFDELSRDFLALKEEYNARAKLEEMIDRLSNTSTQQSSSENTAANNTQQQQPSITQEQIQSLVSNEIAKNETQRREQTNFELVKSKLQERFGTNYTNTLKQQIATLGLSEGFVDELARKHPTVLFKTLGLDQKPQENFQNPVRSSQRSDSFSPTAQQKRTWSYYQNMRRENPKSWSDPKIQVQMSKDHIQLGDEFEDGDFHLT